MDDKITYNLTDTAKERIKQLIDGDAERYVEYLQDLQDYLIDNEFDGEPVEKLGHLSALVDLRRILSDFLPCNSLTAQSGKEAIHE